MFKKIALTAAALGVVSVSAIATSSTAEAGYHHRPHYRPHHVYVPFFRPHYIAPRPHYVTYGCHYKKQLVDTPWGYKWQVVKVCPGHVW